MYCVKCDTTLEAEERLRTECTPETGALSVTGYTIGRAVESPLDSPERRCVDYRPASGGMSISETNSKGSFKVVLSGPLERGTPAESRVIGILTQLLRDSDNEARSLPGARDERGEDGLLEVNGRQLVVQIVTMPVASDLWRELATDDASRVGTQREAVRLLRQTLQHKALTAQGTLLAIDSAHFGALVDPRLVETYLATHGDPTVEFSFSQVWIVGPTARSSICLASGTA